MPVSACAKSHETLILKPKAAKAKGKAEKLVRVYEKGLELIQAMAEGMTDDDLMGIVDSFKRKRLGLSDSQTLEDKYNRLERDTGWIACTEHV